MAVRLTGEGEFDVTLAVVPLDPEGLVCSGWHDLDLRLRPRTADAPGGREFRLRGRLLPPAEPQPPAPPPAWDVPLAGVVDDVERGLRHQIALTRRISRLESEVARLRRLLVEGGVRPDVVVGGGA